MATPTTSRSSLMSQVVLVDDFLDLAKQYRKAYYDLPEPMPSWPKYFLFCHSIELVLKAYLPSRPGEFHPEPLTDPDLTLSRHPARATA